MAKRRRLLAWLAGVVLVTSAVVVLRETDPGTRDEGEESSRHVVERYAADSVVLPAPGRRPEQPRRLLVSPEPGQLRVYWADAVPAGRPLAGASGYEVRWARVDGVGRERVRLVAAPDVQLDGLDDGHRYRIRVRTVDAYGRRSPPTEETGVPGRGDRSWRNGLTGLYEDFTEPGANGTSAVSADYPGSRWHVSGYRGCVRVRAGQADRRGLPIDLDCGADTAVLRARTPLRLSGGRGELGRVVVRTDAAGPGGELTVDLVPGRADQVGVGTLRAARAEERDPALPGGSVRVSVSDAGTLVGVAPDVPGSSAQSAEVHPAPRRGPGVTHLFEVVLTTSGVRVYQDGLAVAGRAVVPQWREAWVLLGFRGPDGRQARVHLASAGFSGPSSPRPAVVEAPVILATQRVLAPGDPAPGVGMARTPLRSATRARLVATLMVNRELDPRAVAVQFGEVRVPARPAVARPARHQGASLTVVAEVPAALLGPRGSTTVTPFVLRAAGANPTAAVLETYLEITPTPAWRAPERAAEDRERRVPDAAPEVVPELGNAAGEPLDTRTVPRRGQLVLTVRSDATEAQWDTGTVAGVTGIEVRLDGTLIAGIPTATDGPGVGGTYKLSLAVGGLSVEDHTVEVRQYQLGDERPQSALLTFTVTS
ncbi:fibronectin type III domain-containing protein [Actinophytocola xanthii]|uniref:Fibronectin type-III domain-containing protein n=1 Tax=Actinophytocola xanthii TaxID=1912961 RepID=A0A1Q8CL19_9PSEU|nr:fibronectin type III domain-containing protein [Actinophytocola xanthii]OLF15048.1 hypothetical protein BU204_23505 [Actinophytocola xanthii]